MKKYRAIIILLIQIFVVIKSYSCTFFYVASDDKVLFGSNEDWISADSYIWYLPSEKDSYGCVFFGFELFPGEKVPFCGMNEKGLVFDTGLSSDKCYAGENSGETYPGNIFYKILKECATIDEVLKILNRYNNIQTEYGNSEIIIGDKHGNSIIIDCGIIGEKTNAIQISPDDSKAENPCKQYTITYNMIKESDEISIDLFKRILANTHIELNNIVTAYSAIFDLRKNEIYVYLFHNYMEEIVIDLNKELKNGNRTVELYTLFPQNIAIEDFKLLQRDELVKKKNKRMAKYVSAEDLQHFSGKYINPYNLNDTIVIENEDDKIYLVNNKDIKNELFPESENKLFMVRSNGDFSFSKYKENANHKTILNIEYEFFGLQIPYERIE
ncbi:MAG: hypothetical protein V2B15_02535 [Bacteroidota bacterium]